MKWLGYGMALLGLVLLFALFIRADATALTAVWHMAGWSLLGVVPYRGVYFWLYARGWLVLLRPFLPSSKVRFSFLLWLTMLREAIDRLLPVASVGGGVAAIRLLMRRQMPFAPVASTIIAEIVLTLWASYLFALLGVSLAYYHGVSWGVERNAIFIALCFISVPVCFTLLLNRGVLFGRCERILSALLGTDLLAAGARCLDYELSACLKRLGSLLWAGGLQFLALLSVSAETWFIFNALGHPVSLQTAVILESATQAIRHIGFFVPAGIGIQEAGLIVAGQALGVSAELALAVSMGKRLRELICGVPALLTWQWFENWRRPLITRFEC